MKHIKTLSSRSYKESMKKGDAGEVPDIMSVSM